MANLASQLVLLGSLCSIPSAQITDVLPHLASKYVASGDPNSSSYTAWQVPHTPSHSPNLITNFSMAQCTFQLALLLAHKWGCWDPGWKGQESLSGVRARPGLNSPSTVYSICFCLCFLPTSLCLLHPYFLPELVGQSPICLCYSTHHSGCSTGSC